MKKLLLGLALSGALAACQPVAPAAAPVAAPAASESSYLTLPEAYTEHGLLPRETDVLFLKPAAGRLEVPLQYERSMVETLVWEGDGQGLAELYNDHGQLLYRVKEGEPAQTVTIGAGRHTLQVRGATSDVLTMAEPEGAASQLRHFEQFDALLKRATAEAESADHRGPIFGDPSERPPFVPRPCGGFAYDEAPPPGGTCPRPWSRRSPSIPTAADPDEDQRASGV